jgi:hypothetical protein
MGVRGRRVIAAGLAGLSCAAIGVARVPAQAGEGAHYPQFSLLDKKVLVTDLPKQTRWLIAGPPGAKGFGFFPHLGHGPIWFGQVEQPNATIVAAAKGHLICQFELPKNGLVGPSGVCVPSGYAREFGSVHVGSCGKGRPTHFRIHALVPDGVTGVAVEREDGTIGHTVPVIENTVAFTIGRENIVLRGVGDAGAEDLQRKLPLADAARAGDDRAGCTSYSFFEAATEGE